MSGLPPKALTGTGGGPIPLRTATKPRNPKHARKDSDMETLQWTHIDKSEWGEGPWMSEPDKMQWLDTTTGLPCLIVRNHGGALCGYVGIAATHPWHGKEYGAKLGECGHVRDDPDASYCWECPTIDGRIDVHGGLTYSDSCMVNAPTEIGICHVPSEGEPDDVWWFGFDTAHSGDHCPGYHRYTMFGQPETYKDIGYVQGECSRLAAQLVAVV